MSLPMRRILMLSMSVVVLTAAVGVACLVLAASALGMPAGHPMGDCGSASVASCPHDAPVNSVPAASSVSVHALDLAIVAPGEHAGRGPLGLAFSAGSVLATPPPVSHLTPLRL